MSFKLLNSSIKLYTFFPDYCHVSAAEHRYVHSTSLASGNWFLFDLRSTDVENLEVTINRGNNLYNPPTFINTILHFFLNYFFRISVIFRVRSAKAVKITDMNLLKRVGVIVMVFSALLGIRTLVAPPIVIVARTADDLKAFLCRTDWWDHSFTIRKEFFFLFNY